MKRFTLALVFVLVLVLMPAQTVWASNECVDSPDVLASYTVQTIDSRVGGGYWAYDNDLESDASIYELGEETWCVYVTQAGTFVTVAGVSPSGADVVGEGVTGTIVGDFSALVYGASDPASGDQGNFDYNCDITTGVCPDYVPWRNILFGEWESFTYTSWGWTYTAVCPSNGEWVNADTGNLGDITGEADFTCIIVDAVPGSIMAFGRAKLLSIPNTMRIGVDNAFEIAYKSGRGKVCNLRLWGGDLGAPIFAQVVPGSMRYEGGRIYASYSLSDLSTGATLVDFHGMDRLEKVHASCHGANGGTANGSVGPDGQSFSNLTILNHTAPR